MAEHVTEQMAEQVTEQMAEQEGLEVGSGRRRFDRTCMYVCMYVHVCMFRTVEQNRWDQA